MRGRRGTEPERDTSSGVPGKAGTSAVPGQSADSNGAVRAIGALSPVAPVETGSQEEPATARASLAYLQELVERKSLDTIVVAGVDFQGRLFGKHLDARHFLRSGAQGTYASVAALANDVRLELVEGLSFGGWESGFPDMLLRPDFFTARLLSWRPGTALVLADIIQPTGEELEISPRAVLRRQLERAARLGLSVYSGSELEFYVFRETAESARAKDYAGLQMLSNFPADYNLLRSSRDEWFFQSLRNGLSASGIPVESSKPEWGHSQGEVNLAYADALEMADRHAIFKQATKEMAEANGLLVTFMAKPFTEQPGSGCHIHMSLRAPGSDQRLFFDSEAPFGMGTTMRHFLGGLQRLAGDLFLFYAPYVNSYKRFIPGNFAPCRNVWGIDNRTSAFRVAGAAGNLRIENRIPGADVNGYLAMSAMLASGLYGLEHGIEPLEGPGNGNICDLDAPRFPENLAEAISGLDSSREARGLLGETVVENLLAFARAELKAYFHEVTDWERRAYLEQI